VVASEVFLGDAAAHSRVILRKGEGVDAKKDANGLLNLVLISWESLSSG
jgi:hypothetical protein